MASITFVPNQEYTVLQLKDAAMQGLFKPGTLLEIVTLKDQTKKVTFVFQNWSRESIRKQIVHVGIKGVASGGRGLLGHPRIECVLHSTSDEYFFPKYAKPGEEHEYGVMKIKYLANNLLDIYLPDTTPVTIKELIRLYLYRF